MSARRLALYRHAVEALRWLRLVMGTCVLGAALLVLVGWLTACRQAAVAEDRLAREWAAVKTLRRSTEAAERLAEDQGWTRNQKPWALTSAAVADLNRSAQALGNLVSSVQPVTAAGAPDEKAGDAVGVELAMQGTFDSAYAFLRRLDAQGVPLAIESLDYRPQPGADGTTRLEVRLKLGVAAPEG
jgi:hypothetical protein